MSCLAAEVPGMADTYDLAFIQGQRFRRGFRWRDDVGPRSLVGYSFRAQVRAKELANSALLLDLTPHISLDAEGTTLMLDLPAQITAQLQPRAFKSTASWDFFLWPTDQFDDAFLFVQGAVTIDPSSTDMARET